MVYGASTKVREPLFFSVRSVVIILIAVTAWGAGVLAADLDMSVFFGQWAVDVD